MTKNRLFHWIKQLLPPFLLFMVLNRNGAGMWFLLALPGVFFIYSTISIISKIIAFRRNRDRIARPVLTVIISLALFSLANYSYRAALAESREIFDIFSKACTSADNCSPNLAGWEKTSDVRYRRTVGKHITYVLFYRKLDQGFHLYLYKFHDIGNEFVKEW